MRRVSRTYPLIWGLVPVFLCFTCAHPVPQVPVPPAAGPAPTAPVEPSRVVVPPPPPGATPEQIAEYQRLQYENDLTHERAMREYRQATVDYQRNRDQWEMDRNRHEAAVAENRSREGRTEGGGAGAVAGGILIAVGLIALIVWAAGKTE